MLAALHQTSESFWLTSAPSLGSGPHPTVQRQHLHARKQDEEKGERGHTVLKKRLLEGSFDASLLFC